MIKFYIWKLSECQAWCI